jgi:AbiU2
VSMANDERTFERMLEDFRQQAGLPGKYFIANVTMDRIAVHNPDVHSALNRDAEFWAVASNALHLSSFIALYRLFDTKSRGNVHAVVRFALQRPSMFSARARNARSQEGASTSGYEPTANDFRYLRQQVARRQVLFEKYRRIRGQVLAHRVLDEVEAAQRYAMTRVDEVQELCLFFPAFHQALLRFYRDGIKPDLSSSTYSAEEVRSGKAANDSQRRVIEHTERALLSLIGSQS